MLGAILAGVIGYKLGEHKGKESSDEMFEKHAQLEREKYLYGTPSWMMYPGQNVTVVNNIYADGKTKVETETH